jgi:hypothetical protein
MRIIGLDIHRAFAEAVAWDDGKLKRLGRVDMRRHLLEAFVMTPSREGCGRYRGDRKRVLGRGGDRASCQESCDRESKASAQPFGVGRGYAAFWRKGWARAPRQ